MPELFKGIFGDKSWYQSLTGVGVAVFVGASAYLAVVCGCDIATDAYCTQGPEAAVSPAVCIKIGHALQLLGGALGALGIRKAQNPKPASPPPPTP